MPPKKVMTRSISAQTKKVHFRKGRPMTRIFSSESRINCTTIGKRALKKNSILFSRRRLNKILWSVDSGSINTEKEVLASISRGISEHELRRDPLLSRLWVGRMKRRPGSIVKRALRLISANAIFSGIKLDKFMKK